MGIFSGKVALVTGAANKRGMGRAMALCLAREGADVVVNDIAGFGIRNENDEDRKEGWQGLVSVVSEIRTLGCRSLGVEADITSQEQVKEMVSKAEKEFGGVDILVNNAGITGPQNKPVLDLSEEEWQRVFAINVMGTVHCSREAARIMINRNKGGKIINIASIRGKVGAAGWGPYTASKFAVVGLTQTLACELAPHKINVNAVCPGLIATEIGMGASIRNDTRSGMSLDEATQKAYAGSLSAVPLGRAAQPEEVAGVVAFLASPAADYITGQSLNVCGGWVLAH